MPPPKERFQNPTMDMTQPVTSPTMSGGAFAIDRKYFHKLGGYDEGVKILGGENLEMSFRVCGVTISCDGPLFITLFYFRRCGRAVVA